MFNVVSIGWNIRQKDWTIYIDRCKIKSRRKSILEIYVFGTQRNIYIHKSIFNYLTMFYKTDEDTDDYTNIDWAASNLKECIFFIESENDIQRGISYFYRTLEKIENNEDLKGNKISQFIDRTRFSHGLF
jgi:hypothetical protein